MKLLPKGISRFTEIIDQSKYFVDRTPYIGKLDGSGENFLFFVRPRRFGKSVFIDMLEAYYDIAQKERFGHYFRDTWIYDHVTPEQGKYQVIHLDFSKITANLENIEDEFNVIVGYDIEDHARKYRVMYDDDFIPKMESFVTAKAKLNHFCTQARRRGYSLYLLVDEYDNFTNAVLSSAGKAGYLEITHGTGFYREFFKVVKTGFQKIFMTGIVPVTMDDLTSGFNIATNITLNPKYNGMMGFSVAEIREIIEYYRGEGKLAGLDTEEIIAEMAPWYDNYCFSEDAFSSHDQVFNSYMVTTFLSELADSGRMPKNMLVSNTLVDYEKLKRIASLSGTLGVKDSEYEEFIEKIILGKISPSRIVESFPAEELPYPANFQSYLFYLGMLTVTGVVGVMPVLGIPNENVRIQYYSYLQKCVRDTDWEIVSGMGALALNAGMDGNIRPLTESILEACAKYSGNRQLKLREGLFQTFFLSFMYWNDVFEPAPEIEMNHGYNDIFLFPKKGSIGVTHSFLIELKYLDAESTEYRKEQALIAAREQLEQYVQDARVAKLSQDTVLHKVVIVIKGFKLDCFEEEAV